MLVFKFIRFFIFLTLFDLYFSVFSLHCICHDETRISDFSLDFGPGWMCRDDCISKGYDYGIFFGEMGEGYYEHQNENELLIYHNNFIFYRQFKFEKTNIYNVAILSGCLNNDIESGCNTAFLPKSTTVIRKYSINDFECSSYDPHYDACLNTGCSSSDCVVPEYHFYYIGYNYTHYLIDGNKFNCLCSNKAIGRHVFFDLINQGMCGQMCGNSEEQFNYIPLTGLKCFKHIDKNYKLKITDVIGKYILKFWKGDKYSYISEIENYLFIDDYLFLFTEDSYQVIYNGVLEKRTYSICEESEPVVDKNVIIICSSIGGFLFTVFGVLYKVKSQRDENRRREIELT